MAGIWQRCVGVPAGSETGSVSVCLPCCRWQALLLDLACWSKATPVLGLAQMVYFLCLL